MTHGLLRLPLAHEILLRTVPSKAHDSSPYCGKSGGTSRSLQIYNEYQKVYKVVEVQNSEFGIQGRALLVFL
jgi:hypothetical protein